LSGTCAWSKNPTSSAKGATPSGVSLSNAYGRCGALTGDASPVALPVSAYSGGKYTPWPTNGIVDAGTYSVSTNVTCATTQVSCPSLVVSQGNAVIVEYDPNAQNQVKKDVPVGDCFDAQYTWKDAGWHPNMNVRCDIDPQFVWAETVNQSRKGYVGLTYSGTTVSNLGDYGVSAIVRVGNNLQVTSNPVEIMNICTDAYIADATGTKVAEATGKTLKCYMTTNDN